MVTIDDLVTDDLLARAFAWLCQRRRHFPAGADVWDFRRRWPAERACVSSWALDTRHRFAYCSPTAKRIS